MLSYYFRAAARGSLRFKLQSLINVVSLVFGLFCVVAALLLAGYFNGFDTHSPDADRVFVIAQDVGTTGGARTGSMPLAAKPVAAYLRTEFPELAAVARSVLPQATDVSFDDKNATIAIRYVEPAFLDIFPLPIVGAGAASSAALPPSGALISHAAAMRLFGSTDVANRHLLIDGKIDVTLVGVTEAPKYASHVESMVTPLSSELIAPIDIFDRMISQSATAQLNEGGEGWESQSYTTYVKFAASPVDRKSFEGRLAVFASKVIPDNKNKKIVLSIVPINAMVPSLLASFSGGVNILGVLIFAGCLVLLVASLNCSNLILAQLIQRNKEMAVQRILGAQRRQLLIQHSFDSGLLVLVSLAIALSGCYLLLSSMQQSGAVGVTTAMLLEPRLWVAIVTVCGGIVLVSGTYPALRVFRTSSMSMLRSRGSRGYSHRLRALMVGTQFGFSSVLLILVFVMYSQSRHLTQTLGRSSATANVVIPFRGDTAGVDADVLVNELERHPGIRSATRSLSPPWFFGVAASRTLSRLPDAASARVNMRYNVVSYDYFGTVDIDLLAGRAFSPDYANDLLPSGNRLLAGTGPYSVVLNEAAIRKLGWNSAEEAIGQTVYQHLEPPVVLNPVAVPQTIIGVTENKSLSLVNFGLDSIAYTLDPDATGYIILRVAKDDLSGALAHVDTVWKALLPRVALKRQIADDLFQQTYSLFLGVTGAITALAVVAFAISSFGLVGMATYLTSLRTQEVGIRKAMGASSFGILRMLLRDFSKPVLIANLVAWPISFPIARGYLSIFTDQVSLTPLPFILSLGVAVAITWLAVGNQAYKSARVKPARVLAHE